MEQVHSKLDEFVSKQSGLKHSLGLTSSSIRSEVSSESLAKRGEEISWGEEVHMSGFKYGTVVDVLSSAENVESENISPTNVPYKPEEFIPRVPVQVERPWESGEMAEVQTNIPSQIKTPKHLKLQNARSLIMAIDNDESSLKALQWCIKNDFIHSYDNLLLVHSIESGETKINQESLVDFKACAGGDVQSFFKSYNSVCEQLKVNGIFDNAKLLISNNSIGEVLVESCRKFGAELLIVGSKPAGSFIRALAPNVNDYVVRHATCSVLIVKTHHGIQ
ncbi:hypothetical protein ROZALSC1DRAFT_28877 [Rozella allomycis CSF55]|uniref:UspA domain-containing protein n=1 Tax=Rozella allomycis (strain CSF55) TaxID=988480 RepID=A0A4P9YLY8_ROZAC|nr:hypothetical protein ROZALSC1DRAFT_28877 [Rozella allomycis CSF55]